MKAKHLKEHQKKPKIEIVEDEWEDKRFMFDGVMYQTKQDALEAAQKKLEKEFRERYVK